MAGIFVKINDKQMGPYSSRELEDLATKGEFDQNDLVFHEDSQEWIEAGKLKELQELFHPERKKQRKRIVYAIGGGKGGVGKTVLSASLGIGLSALGNQVILVDADLGGANLHTCVGLLEPVYTFYHFYTLQKEKLEDIVLDTPLSNLKLISGACGTLGLANPRYSQKLRFINSLRQLNADYVLVDLGAGSSYNVIDFFLAADQGILVTTPEPMAIQETFNFVKVTVLRKFFREFRREPNIMEIFEREIFTQPGRMNSTMHKIIEEVNKIDSHAAEKMHGFLDTFQPHFILNMVHSADEIKEGDTLRTAAKELLAVDIDYIGFVENDESVRQSVKDLKPFIVHDPKSKASRGLARLISAGLLHKTGWERFREKRNVLKQVSHEAPNYPDTDLNDDSTICSVQCFYWGDCEYQNGGFPCPIRHLDPIFHR